MKKKNICQQLLNIICNKQKDNINGKKKKIKSPYNSENEDNLKKSNITNVFSPSEKILLYHKNFPQRFQTEYFNKKEKDYYSKLLIQEKKIKKHQNLKFKINFREDEKIEKGAFGLVSRGFDKNNKIEMASKQIFLEKSLNPTNLKKIISEFEILKNLNHKNIVTVYGYKIQNNFLNIYMEYLNEGSILNILKNFKKLNEKVVSHYTHQILKG